MGHHAKTTHIWVVSWLFLVVWGCPLWVGGSLVSWLYYVAMCQAWDPPLLSKCPCLLVSRFTLGTGLLTICLFCFDFSKTKETMCQCMKAKYDNMQLLSPQWLEVMRVSKSSRLFDLLFFLWGLNQMLLMFSSLSVGGERAIGEGSLFQQL